VRKVPRPRWRRIRTPRGKLARYNWVIDHARPFFSKAPGADENAKNTPQENAATEGGVRGYYPVTWCAERLPPGIRVVSPEELVWRIRLEHNPAQTKRFLSQ